MAPSIQPALQRRQKRPRGDYSQSPLLVFFEVTRACDLVCDHCRACAQSEPASNELSTQQAIQLIDELTEFGSPPMLVLTGGDPLKRSDIFDLVQYAVSRRLNVSITPSATPLVTPAALYRLRRAGISRLAVSIDGADSQTHDTRRGVAGSFDRTLRILGDAYAEGIPAQVNTTITPQNANQIDRMADLLAEQRIVMWSVFFLVPTGRAFFSPRLSAEQCEDAFKRLWRQSKRQTYAIKTTAAPHYRRFVKQRETKERNAGSRAGPLTYAPLGLNDGNGVMFISHCGDIYPSGFMPIFCGRFPNAHLVRVYQDSPLFRGLRNTDRLQGKCKICEFRNVCGGSRARAYAVTGNPYSEEPDCAYVPDSIARSRNTR
ncbi:MAG TPA: TIGR04053 family radical SAM/SPASM domain-containing protein [Lacipirellulaceae bacterium]